MIFKIDYLLSWKHFTSVFISFVSLGFYCAHEYMNVILTLACFQILVYYNKYLKRVLQNDLYLLSYKLQIRLLKG